MEHGIPGQEPRIVRSALNENLIAAQPQPHCFATWPRRRRATTSSQGHRGIRLDQLFTARHTHDRAANIVVQNDVVNARAQRLVPAILRLLPSDDAVAMALSNWDFAYTPDSAAPTVFETFMAQWQRAMVAGRIPLRLHDLVVQQTGLGCALLLDPERPFFPAGTEATARSVAHGDAGSDRRRSRGTRRRVSGGVGRPLAAGGAAQLLHRRSGGTATLGRHWGVRRPLFPPDVRVRRLDRLTLRCALRARSLAQL